MTLTLQYSQTGARACMAHSKLSKVCVSPPGILMSKDLSYSFPQTSHWAISILLSRNIAVLHFYGNYPDPVRDKRPTHAVKWAVCTNHRRADGKEARRGPLRPELEARATLYGKCSKTA